MSAADQADGYVREKIATGHKYGTRFEILNGSPAAVDAYRKDRLEYLDSMADKRARPMEKPDPARYGVSIETDFKPGWPVGMTSGYIHERTNERTVLAHYVRKPTITEQLVPVTQHLPIKRGHEPIR